jgi:hypothetical protein
LINAHTLARGDEFPMNFVPFSALLLAMFAEFSQREVQLPRIYIPRTWLNKGKKKGRSVSSPGHGEKTSASTSVM